jgi:hypothetical protein
MPLIKSKSKKAFEKNVATEMRANPGPENRAQNLAIAYSVKRKAAHKKKMAKGGNVDEGPSEKENQSGVHKIVPNYEKGKGIKHGQSEAGGPARATKNPSRASIDARSGDREKTISDMKQLAKKRHSKVLEELRSMPHPKLKGLAEGGIIEDVNDRHEIARQGAQKALEPKQNMTSPENRTQALTGMRTTKIKHPSMAPSSVLSARLLDEEDDLQTSAGVNNGPQRQPPEHDNEEGANRQGPDVPDLHMKMMAEGGDIKRKKSDQGYFLERAEEMTHPETKETYKSIAKSRAIQRLNAERRHTPHPKLKGLAKGGSVDDPERTIVIPDKGYGKIIMTGQAEGGEIGPVDELADERYNSIAAAIMARRSRMLADEDGMSGSDDMNEAEMMAKGGKVRGHHKLLSDDRDSFGGRTVKILNPKGEVEHLTADEGEHHTIDRELARRGIKKMANGGIADVSVPQHEDDASLEEGQVDLDDNERELPNAYYGRNEDKVLKENYDEDIMDMSQPTDSNEIGDDREDETSDPHDMVDAIRRRMKSRRQMPQE